jgi:hypothetical protein
MVKKVNYSKKSYSRRISKRNYRRTYRRKGKKNKKTRKRNKRGGAEGSVYLPPPELRHVEGQGLVRNLDLPASAPENLFGETISDDRTLNTLRTLYGGDPEEMSKRIQAYKEALIDPEESMGEESMEDKQRRLIQDFFPEGFPTNILISGHGSMINCSEFGNEPCFTILPRGYKLILATETGGALITNSLLKKQQGATYYRMYEGLIPNQWINFDLVYEGGDGELNEGKMGRVRSDLPGVILTGAKEGVLKGGEMGAVLRILDYYLNLIANIPRDIQMDLARKIKNRSASPEEIDEYADKLIDDLLTLPTSPTSPIIDCYSNYSVIPKEKIKEQIVNSVSQHLGKSGFDKFKLSQILKYIEKVGETDENIPKVILGGFCRGGDFTYNIDGIISSSIGRWGLPELREEYFTGDITYEGELGAQMTKQYSLASKTKSQDFWNIIDHLNMNLKYFTEDPLDLDRTAATDDEYKSFIQNRDNIVSNFEAIIGKIERESENKTENDIYTGINLSFTDVCLIFKMDNCLKLHPSGLPIIRGTELRGRIGA